MTLLFLGEDEPAVNRNLKDTARSCYQLHLGIPTQLPLQLVPQTGGTGFIISLAAVFNRNFHMYPLSYSPAKQQSFCLHHHLIISSWPCKPLPWRVRNIFPPDNSCFLFPTRPVTGIMMLLSENIHHNRIPIKAFNHACIRIYRP